MEMLVTILCRAVYAEACGDRNAAGRNAKAMSDARWKVRSVVSEHAGRQDGLETDFANNNADYHHLRACHS